METPEQTFLANLIFVELNREPQLRASLIRRLNLILSFGFRLVTSAQFQGEQGEEGWWGHDALVVLGCLLQRQHVMQASSQDLGSHPHYLCAAGSSCSPSHFKPSASSTNCGQPTVGGGPNCSPHPPLSLPYS